MKDVVVDVGVMKLYDQPKDDCFRSFFSWLCAKGTLVASKGLVSEYGRQGNQLVFVLISRLQREGRYVLAANREIKDFKRDKHFKYTCNKQDIPHARLVFLSPRKRLISIDKKMVSDVNRFPKVDGVKACACHRPADCCDE